MNKMYSSLKVWFIGPLALIGLIGGCTTFEESIKDQGFRRLNSSEIQSSFAGNTFIGRFVGSENAITVFFAADGTMRATSVVPSGKVYKDEGHWRTTEDDWYCDKWEKWQAASDCDSIYIRGDENVFVNTDGTKSASGTIEQGNPKGL